MEPRIHYARTEYVPRFYASASKINPAKRGEATCSLA
jgi:hypothetical protein